MKRKEQIFITKIYKSKKCDFCGVKGKNGVPLGKLKEGGFYFFYCNSCYEKYIKKEF